MKKFIQTSKFFTFLLLCFSFALAAQESISVSGVIKDAFGEPIPGANVLVKGTKQGVSTDIDGRYTIEVPKGGQLSFSAMGKKTVIETVTGSTLDILLEDDTEVLGEVVLSALGIEEKKDESGNSVSVVATDLIEKSGETGIIQSLSGKASGLKITRNSGDPGGGAFMQIRGAKTITGNTQPLIILDGVPLDNGSPNTGSVGGVVEQSRLNDINFSDVEDVQILKGAAAAALWGTRAANGVIVIKTKSGSKQVGGSSVSGSVSATISFDQVNREFEKQNKYGQGSGGKFVPNVGVTWGG